MKAEVLRNGKHFHSYDCPTDDAYKSLEWLVYQAGLQTGEKMEVRPDIRKASWTYSAQSKPLNKLTVPYGGSRVEFKLYELFFRREHSKGKDVCKVKVWATSPTQAARFLCEQNDPMDYAWTVFYGSEKIEGVPYYAN